ncbi:MAG: PQQ-binding-like beta-propeller repeat protein [Hyphomonadaceae bacterium]|nr:PQQ-binding-like beta-propeller repeat protein [Hyphomonadaceae bacterium]
MRLPHIVACAALVFVGIAEAQQAPASTWQHVADVRYRGEIKDIELAANGDIVVSGFSPGVRGYVDGWVARFDATGRQLWSRLVGGNPRDEILDLALAPDGDIVVSGWRDIAAFVSNGLVARYSPNGDLRWSRTIEVDGSLALYEIMVRGDGEVIAAGRHATRNDTQMHPFMVALDSAGQTRWTFDSYEHSPSPTKMKSAVVPTSAISLASDGVIELQQTFNQHAYGECVRVSLETGNLLGGTCDASVPARAKSRRGRPTYAAYESGPLAARDPFVRKFSASGALVWEKALTSENNDGANDVAETADGGAVVAGYETTGDRIDMHNWNGLLIRLGSDGTEIWRRRFGGSRRDEFTSVAVMPDSSIIVAGYTGSQGDANDWAPWLLRLNSSGELEGEAKLGLERRQN